MRKLEEWSSDFLLRTSTAITAQQWGLNGISAAGASWAGPGSQEKMVLSPLYYGGQIKRDIRTLSLSRQRRIHTTQSGRDVHTLTWAGRGTGQEHRFKSCPKDQISFFWSPLLCIRGNIWPQWSSRKEKNHLSHIIDCRFCHSLFCVSPSLR